MQQYNQINNLELQICNNYGNDLKAVKDNINRLGSEIDKR
jgi:hypothetical protein